MGSGHHNHSHAHSDTRASRRRLALVLGLVTVYMFAEVAGGLLSGSLALLADAGHMLSDAAALALALFALWIAQRPPSPQRSYGYYRAEILAALVNGATLVAIAVFVFVEAFQRLSEPPEVQGLLMTAVATGGLAINLAGLWILSAGRRGSHNERGAWLHVLADALGSVGAIVAGVLVWAFGWTWADPAASVLIAIFVLYASWSLLKETVSVLMEHAPRGLDVDAVRDAIAGVEGVTSVHDLHVWTITSGMVALSAHVTTTAPDYGRVLIAVRHVIHEQFGIDHSTIQVEPPGFDEAPLTF